MAHIFVRDSLTVTKAARLDINFPIMVTTNSEGDPIWLLEVATTYPSASGTDITPVYVNKATSYEDLDEPIAEAVAKIAKQIDWLPLVEDTQAPFVVEYRPEGENVSIMSHIYIDLEEYHPSAGIDLSDAQVVLNNGVFDFDITSECVVTGNPFRYNLLWRPRSIEFKRYDSED